MTTHIVLLNWLLFIVVYSSFLTTISIHVGLFAATVIGLSQLVKIVAWVQSFFSTNFLIISGRVGNSSIAYFTYRQWHPSFLMCQTRWSKTGFDVTILAYFTYRYNNNLFLFSCVKLDDQFYQNLKFIIFL